MKCCITGHLSAIRTGTLNSRADGLAILSFFHQQTSGISVPAKRPWENDSSMSGYLLYSDTELVNLLREGDEHAFEVIYRRYVKELYRYAVRKVQVREDCEEIVHDVFASLWKRRDHLEITSLKHYLYTSVRYVIIRYFSHRNVKRKFADHYRLFEAIYDSMDEPQRLDPETIHARLLEHIQGLPDRCQEAIRLRLTEKLSNGEIAERMKINKGTVELYISKAFRYLRGAHDTIFRPAE